MVTAAPPPHAAPRPATPPHHVLVRLGGHVTDTLLIATVEGQARLIGTALTLPDGPDRGVGMGLTHLAARTGFPLQPEMAEIAGVILDTRPMALLLIGERAEGDAHALSTVRGLGVVRYFSIPDVPPRHPARQRDWPDAVLTAWRFGKIAAALVDVPDGPLTLWVAHLFNTVSATDDAPPLLIVASDARIADLAPPGARVLARGEHLPERLASALAEVQAQRLIPTGSAPAQSIFRRQALVTATIAAQRENGAATWYLDIADGTTLIGADGARADVTYEPALDCGVGAPALLAETPAPEMARWLPFGVDIDTARRWTIRRAAWPAAILTDSADRAMAGAFARTLIGRIADADALAAAEMIVLGPGWLRWATPAEMLDIVADVIAPPNPVRVALDPDDLLAATGFLASVRPESAESLFLHDALRPIGTVIAAPSRPQRHPPPLRLTLTAGGVQERREIAGETVLRLPIHEAVTVHLARDGAATAAHAILPSECGLVIDTRHRPLTATRTPEPRGTVSDRLRAAP